ncbi:hypothetical protein TSOC_009088 [Tetrabaena socialis]|uniref:Glycoside hydrolase family 42 N-terminal domain-containing protein n=1 Tax=Tetrabaena socialis TaxID=47790 RepID=A0A2J7ZWR6_9CHLO|nr:hypothetical protein TSOC_009088 [Tetrabaena socialis]|eukprot:PNH04709.1 hypothetical protein TSOC_009088 [Tetrabaena socialis]
MILDLVAAPQWLWDRYYDARAFDSDGRNYTRLSWFHPLGGEAARAFLGKAAAHLAQAYPGCIQAIQPVYNNAYEAKFTQEHDAFQDYSPYALLAYREWLSAKRPHVELVNMRWGTGFKSWGEVVPPKLHSGNFIGADFSARYHDWLRFREEFGADIYNRACATVQAAGLQCFHHFPEFFTVMDAIYGAAMFKRIAASPHTDFLIMDSNFLTPYGTVMNPHKLRLYISAAHSYGKPVYFEAAVERFPLLGLLAAGYQSAMLAGADSVGIANWHTRVEMNATLGAIMRAAPECRACELVGVFVHLDSCSAWHGLQWGRFRTNPLHDFIDELAERLSEECGTDVAVYIELNRFLADMPTFTRAVFVEPLVLYGNGELESYIAVKEALKALPHELMHLPTNVTSGPSMVVLQEL